MAMVAPVHRSLRRRGACSVLAPALLFVALIVSVLVVSMQYNPLEKAIISPRASGSYPVSMGIVQNTRFTRSISRPSSKIPKRSVSANIHIQSGGILLPVIRALYEERARKSEEEYWEERKKMIMDPDGKTIVVTGAGGRTGRLLIQQLQGMKKGVREARGVVHSFKSERRLIDNYDVNNTFVADIYANPENLEEAFGNISTLVILTSAMPKIKTRSLLRLMFSRIFRRKASSRPQFRYKQTPEQVDWIGQKNQIDMAKSAGVEHVVLVSSMGGTDPSNMLNKIGDGNILLWKRLAERYLIASGLNYTIIHPGGLTDKEGDFEPLSGVDDELLQRPTRSIARMDLVEVVLQAIFEPKARGRSFDVISTDTPRNDDVYDWDGFFAQCGHCDYQHPDVEAILAREKTLEKRTGGATAASSSSTTNRAKEAEVA
mmetsp:Transcript_16257/g.26855  ORF Transcript_16257/g.26855 Transcript_16257/m.26855 type:complete len:431 (-) Transcript_16257:388-1680(-)